MPESTVLFKSRQDAMVKKFLILFTLNCLLNNRTVNLQYNKAPGKTQWYKNF